MLKVAVLDDYGHLALRLADWGRLDGKADVTVFDHALAEADAATTLAPFDVLCTMRERMALPRRLLESLPRLKLITIVGAAVASLDAAAATERGILISRSPPEPAGDKSGSATPELAWGLMIATVRHLAFEERRMRAGLWQTTAGMTLAGKTLGLLGFGRIGHRMARYAQAFDMDVIAWSQNLTDEAASAGGARRVDKDTLFRQADVVSIHTRLSERTRGLVTAREFALMKPTAYLINTSRGPIVDESALLDALRQKQIAGVGLDVYDVEPLPADHPLRGFDNATLSPHLGYVAEDLMARRYQEAIAAIEAWIAGEPRHIANPDALGRRA